MEENRRVKKDEQQLSQEEIERLELLQRAHDKKGRQLTFSDETGSYREFYLLNEKHEYGHEEYDYSTKSVAVAMLKLSESI